MEKWEQLARIFITGFTCNEFDRRNTFIALFDLCIELKGLKARITHDGSITITSFSGKSFCISSPDLKSKFRNYLAELACLTSNGSNEINPYCGTGYIHTLDCNGICVRLRLEFNNTSSLQEFTLSII